MMLIARLAGNSFKKKMLILFVAASIPMTVPFYFFHYEQKLSVPDTSQYVFNGPASNFPLKFAPQKQNLRKNRDVNFVFSGQDRDGLSVAGFLRLPMVGSEYRSICSISHGFVLFQRSAQE